MLGNNIKPYSEINPFCDLPWEFQILVSRLQGRGPALWMALMVQIQLVGD